MVGDNGALRWCAERRGVRQSRGRAIGSVATSLAPNMGSIGELFMDGYIRFGKRSKRLVREEKPRRKHRVWESRSS